MGLYDRFKGAPVMGVRNYIKPGNHVFVVRKMSIFKSKNPQTKNVENAIVEFKTVKSDTQRPGEICALVETDKSEGYAGNVSAVTAGILGMEVEDMYADPDFEKIFDGAWGEQQVFVDMLVRCIAQQTKTKAGGDYTAKTWEPIKASEYAEYGLVAPEGSYEGEVQAAA